MKLIFLALLLQFSVAKPTTVDFRVEKLTPEEVTTVKTADDELAKAQLKHDATVWVVKVHHGASAAPYIGSMAVYCDYTPIDVELRGEYALISVGEKSYCSMAVPVSGGNR